MGTAGVTVVGIFAAIFGAGIAAAMLSLVWKNTDKRKATVIILASVALLFMFSMVLLVIGALMLIAMMIKDARVKVLSLPVPLIRLYGIAPLGIAVVMLFAGR